MDAQERGEVREMIHGVLEGWQQATIERENLIHASLNSIDKRLDKINGTVAKNVMDIEELRIKGFRHVIDCPAMPKIEKIEQEIIGSWIRKHWKLALLIFTITLFVSYSLFELLGIKEILSYLK